MILQNVMRNVHCLLVGFMPDEMLLCCSFNGYVCRFLSQHLHQSLLKITRSHVYECVLY